MSKRRVYSEDTLAIMERFFRAIYMCCEQKLVKSVSDYCTRNGIERTYFYLQERERFRGYFQVGWMLPLVRDYGISPLWLLTGKGLMFSQ